MANTERITMLPSEMAVRIRSFVNKHSGWSSAEPILIEKVITEPGEYVSLFDAADGYFKVSVQIASGVRFYDFNGTLLYSYTSSDFLNLSQMPQTTVHEGYTTKGWNWSLEDAKKYVREYGMFVIGEVCVANEESDSPTLTSSLENNVLKLEGTGASMLGTVLELNDQSISMSNNNLLLD